MRIPVPGTVVLGPKHVAMLLVVCSVACFQPVLKTGYYAEDQIHSMVRGLARVEGVSVLGHLYRFSEGTLAQGRFFPVTPILARGFHALMPSVTFYKASLIVATVAELLIFFLMLRRWTNDRFAGLASVLVAGLYQFRLSPDPLLGYYLQIQIVAACTFGSLLTLDLYLVGRRLWWLALSLILFAVGLLTYEATAAFGLLHLILICWRVPSFRQRVWAVIPFAIVGLLWLGVMFKVRFDRLPSSDHYILRPSFEPKAYLIPNRLDH